MSHEPDSNDYGVSRPAHARRKGRLPAMSLLLAAPMLLAAGGCASDDDGGAPERVIQVVLSENGCTPATIDAEPGKTRFTVQNPTSSAVKTFELRSGDSVVLSLYNVLGGIARGGTVTLEEGTYVMRCTGGGVDASGEIRVVAAP